MIDLMAKEIKENKYLMISSCIYDIDFFSNKLYQRELLKEND